MRFITKFILLFCTVVYLTACSTRGELQSENILEVHDEGPKNFKSNREFSYWEFTKEFVTIGYLNNKEVEMRKQRARERKAKYVPDEQDDRNILQRTVGALTLGVFQGRETKKEREARLAKEEWEEENIVPWSEDDRDILFKLTSKETVMAKSRRVKAERLKREAEMKVEMEENPPYLPGSVMDHPKLAKLFYDKSTYEDAVKVLGKPIRMTTFRSKEREALFKVEEKRFAYLPMVEKPQMNVRLNFNANGILIKK